MPSLATNTSPDATLKVFRGFYKTYATYGGMNSRRWLHLWWRSFLVWRLRVDYLLPNLPEMLPERCDQYLGMDHLGRGRDSLSSIFCHCNFLVCGADSDGNQALWRGGVFLMGRPLMLEFSGVCAVVWSRPSRWVERGNCILLSQNTGFNSIPNSNLQDSSSESTIRKS
jgi:hypothetical protein